MAGVYSLDPVSRTSRYFPRQWIAYAAGGESYRHASLDNIVGTRIGGLTFSIPIPGDGKLFPVRFLLFRRAQDLLASGTLT